MTCRGRCRVLNVYHHSPPAHLRNSCASSTLFTAMRWHDDVSRDAWRRTNVRYWPWLVAVDESVPRLRAAALGRR